MIKSMVSCQKGVSAKMIKLTFFYYASIRSLSLDAPFWYSFLILVALLATGHKVADLWWQNIDLCRR